MITSKQSNLQSTEFIFNQRSPLIVNKHETRWNATFGSCLPTDFISLFFFFN